MIAVGLDLEADRRSPGSTRSTSGRTSRRRSPASCRGACWSWAAARPAASSPRSTPGSACRRRSSSPGRGSPRPTIRATPRSIREALERGRRRPSGPASGRSRRGPAPGADGAHVIDLDDGSTAEGHAILPRSGATFPLDDLGLEHYGLDTSGRTPPSRATAGCGSRDGLWVIGDPAGPELHTHQAHYQGELAVRMALGEHVEPDYRALPRATYTDPEAAFVGVTLEAAREAGHRRVRVRRRLREERRGLRGRGKLGHVTIVVDRGDARAGRAPRWPVRTPRRRSTSASSRSRPACRSTSLADTIHAFPSTSRIFNGLFADALRELEHPSAGRAGS